MEKTTIKAFTLVEMLIVIVIIGILIASLMPRMQSAQWRARDVARKNDLSQIQTAIITSQQDKWKWPQLDNSTSTATDGARYGVSVGSDTSTKMGAKLAEALQNAWMTQVPTDPNGSNKIVGLWTDANMEAWKYGYLVAKRNSVSDGWFVLMAKTEVEWSSNWIVCPTAATDKTKCTKSSPDALKNCWIFGTNNTVDLKNVVLCSKFEKSTGTTDICEMDGNGNCYYNDEASLRYILVY